MIGKTKFYNEKKGWGFITQDNGDEIFVHCTDLEKAGIENLQEGDEVEFEVTETPRGIRAIDILLIKKSTK